MNLRSALLAATILAAAPIAAKAQAISGLYIGAGAGANVIPTDRMWGAALTLVLLIALLNIAARVGAKIFAPKKV